MDKKGNYFAAIDSSNASRGLYKYANNSWSLARKTNRSKIHYLTINDRGDFIAAQSDGLFVNQNTKPVISKIDDLHASKKSGTVTLLSFNANDAEGDSITYNLINSEVIFIGLNSVNNYVKIDYPKNIVKNYNIRATATDGYLTDTTTFTLKVLDNVAPKISPIPDFAGNEDDTTRFTIQAIDDDGDLIIFTSKTDNQKVYINSGIPMSIDTTNEIIASGNFFGKSKVTIFASDGKKSDSTSFIFTVNNIQDPPQAFEWVSAASDSINITKENLSSNYTLNWTESVDVDNDTINYIMYAKIGAYPLQEIYDTTALSYAIPYEEIAEGAFEGLPGNAATVRFTVWAHDGIDSVKISRDDRILYVNRYQYLSTESDGIPVEFALHENYPNPFNPTTQIRFDLPEMANTSLIIYNMLGQKIKTFTMQSAPAGYHSLTWDATNELGAPVSAGVYLYQLQTKGFVKTKKMILLK